MDGDGRQQDTGRTAASDDDDAKNEDEPIRPEGRGSDRFGGGAMATDRSDKAVEVQSIVETDDYAGSAESGV
ncbi:MAG TPA: hypothetical protein VEZ48_03775 [Sphingomonadaceae bacterium]|nr:hypothetical protein [Sphingomonadaceae bacterium]